MYVCVCVFIFMYLFISISKHEKMREEKLREPGMKPCVMPPATAREAAYLTIFQGAVMRSKQKKVTLRTVKKFLLSKDYSTYFCAITK